VHEETSGTDSNSDVVVHGTTDLDADGDIVAGPGPLSDASASVILN
jgi:hypothetical protein